MKHPNATLDWTCELSINVVSSPVVDLRCAASMLHERLLVPPASRTLSHSQKQALVRVRTSLWRGTPVKVRIRKKVWSCAPDYSISLEGATEPPARQWFMYCCGLNVVES